MAPTSYKSSPSYTWYYDGDGGTAKRHPHLPAFTKNEIAAGEVYCRMPITSSPGEVRLCMKDDRFLNESNLRHHAAKHKLGGTLVTLKKKHSGANSIAEVGELQIFYDDLQKFTQAKATAEEDDDDDADDIAVPATPSKARIVAQVEKKWKVPFTKKRGTKRLPHPKFQDMRKKCGFTGKKRCDGCIEANRTVCPPKTRPDPICDIWDAFAVHPWESAPGVGEDDDEEE